MVKKRDTQTYDLKKGNEIVYRGSTNDIERREKEHRNDGKDFDKIVPTSNPMTKDNAKKREVENLQTYREGHKGGNPKYNKDSDG